MQPLVSIVTPCYNHEQYLDDYFQGLLSQTYRNIELIIIDDCSKDSSWAKICSYESQLKKIFPRVVCTRNATNQGAYKTITDAQRQVSGEYVSLLESDDYYLPTKVEENVNYLQAHPEMGVVHSRAYYIHSDGTPYPSAFPSREEIPTGHIFDHLLIDNFIITCTVCSRRSLPRRSVDSAKHIERGYRMGDYPTWLDLARHTQFGYIAKPLACYRILEESGSHSRDPYKRFLFQKSFSQIKLDYLRDYGVTDPIKRKVMFKISWEALNFACSFYQDRHYRLAAQSFALCLQAGPALLANQRSVRLIAKLLLGERGSEVVRNLKDLLFNRGTGRTSSG